MVSITEWHYLNHVLTFRQYLQEYYALGAARNAL